MPLSEQGGFTHVCLDCGALGVAGGYHDHGDGAAGETIALAELPSLLRTFQDIERDRDDLEKALEAVKNERDLAVLTLAAFTPADKPNQGAT